MQAISKHTTPRVRTIRWNTDFIRAKGILEGEIVPWFEVAAGAIKRRGGRIYSESSRRGQTWHITWPTQE